MFNENYKWNYDYVRLARDSGFSFDRHRTADFDKNKISLIDIDRIIREKDVATVDTFVPCVAQFVLDPEQARILDDNFVKIFRISQLSVEYLLFCKKYLDDSLEKVKEDFLKLREENKELNVFVEELKEHISALMREIKEKNKVVTFKCEHCNKIFSSQEFLTSHVKRRHSMQTNPPLEAETDKLHLEIKELKGRLNSAEKMIQRDKPVLEKESENESRKVDELQQKFEELRLQVQSELKVLQTQHNFQEKYEKLFEKMTLQSSRGQVDGGDLSRRRESTTQTDVELSPKKSTVRSEIPKVDVKNKENIPEVENAQKQITEFGEALETKVTSSLQKIETQMQSFWSKLNEMEIHRTESHHRDIEESQIPPAVKPRSKYTMTSPPTKIEKEKIEDKSPKRKLSKKVQKSETIQTIKAVETKPQVKNLKDPQPSQRMAVTPQLSLDGDDSTSSAITSSDSETVAEPPVKPTPRPAPARRKEPLPKPEKKVVDDELFQYFKEEVEKIIIMGRLQDLGVSPEWKGLPTRSFHRALEIVNHQATLMKKTYPNFDTIAAQLEKEVAKKLKEITAKKKNEKKAVKEKSTDESRKKIVSKKGKVASPQVEIKNRKMYATDSDSEIDKISKVKENLKQFSAPYSAVIEELKTVTTKMEASDASVKEDEVKIEDQNRGVLKNYPSVGSLTKKKVLFNLNNEDRKENKDSGSTTSVASSVLDGTPRTNQKVDKDKDIEDLSDFDFSDM